VFLNDLILFAKGSIGPLVGFTNSDGSQIQYLLNAEIKPKKNSHQVCWENINWVWSFSVVGTQGETVARWIDVQLFLLQNVSNLDIGF